MVLVQELKIQPDAVFWLQEAVCILGNH